MAAVTKLAMTNKTQGDEERDRRINHTETKQGNQRDHKRKKIINYFTSLKTSIHVGCTQKVAHVNYDQLLT